MENKEGVRAGTQEKFAPNALAAFEKLGFKLGDHGNIITLPHFVSYKAEGVDEKVQARILEVLIDESGRNGGVPVLELRFSLSGGKRETIKRVPVTSEELEKFGN